jgi:hypothetical protein
MSYLAKFIGFFGFCQDKIKDPFIQRIFIVGDPGIEPGTSTLSV